MEVAHLMKGSHLIQLRMDRCMGLIYKAISYIGLKTKKYYKGENNISKDAKLKLEVSASIVELPTVV